MSFLKYLFPRFSKATAARSGAPPGDATAAKMSLLAMLSKTNSKVDTKPCAIDQRTSAISVPALTVITVAARIGEIAVDVGGFCKRCNAFRCCQHSMWIDASLAALDDKSRNYLMPDELVQELAKHNQHVDTAFMLGCRVCGTIYDGKGEQRWIIAG